MSKYLGVRKIKIKNLLKCVVFGLYVVSLTRINNVSNMKLLKHIYWIIMDWYLYSECTKNTMRNQIFPFKPEKICLNFSIRVYGKKY